MSAPRVLFVLKKRFVPYGDPANDFPVSYSMSSGLFNSATFVKDMLFTHGITAELVEVDDNNRIDAAVHAFKPTHVIIEAYWVVPEKFAILTKLHPAVQWIVRGHSEIPFIANEGIAMEWTREYLKYPNVAVSSNSPRTVADLRQWVTSLYPDKSKKNIETCVPYLPNYYPVANIHTPYLLHRKDTIDVGCFGAVRPMKNHLLQCFAALDFAKRNGKKLRFHINATRREGGGDKPLKNVRQFFAELGPDYQLIEHEWMTHTEFKTLIKSMDIGMQVSFSETFNIVTADFVDCDVPVVVSDEIPWMTAMFKASMTDSTLIVDKMELALWWKKSGLYDFNRRNLTSYVNKSEKEWTKFFAGWKPEKPDKPDKPAKK